MARTGRLMVSVCAVLLALLALTCAPALAQDAGGEVVPPPTETTPPPTETTPPPTETTPAPTEPTPEPVEDNSPWVCKPLAFVLAGHWLSFSSESGDNSYVVMLQQPVVTAHNIVLVYGMDHRGRAVNDTSALLHPLEFKSGSDTATRVGQPRRGRYLSQAIDADVAMLEKFDNYAPMRFDISVPWNMDTRRYTFAFRHIRCGEQRIVYKYNPRGPLQPIIPSDVPVGEHDPNVTPTPVVPTLPGDGVDHSGLCLINAVTTANQWACTPAFAPTVFDYQCTSPASAFLERITVQAASNFLALKLTVEADEANEAVTRGLLSGIDSPSFPMFPGRNVIEIGSVWGGVCNASYVFEVKREDPVVGAPATGNWRVSEFGACAGNCGGADAGLGGTQTRDAVCVTEAGETVDESRCAAPKPATSQACELTCGTQPEPTVPTPGGDGGFAAIDSAAPTSAAVSPLAMFAVAAFALLALNH